MACEYLNKAVIKNNIYMIKTFIPYLTNTLSYWITKVMGTKKQITEIRLETARGFSHLTVSIYITYLARIQR